MKLNFGGKLKNPNAKAGMSAGVTVGEGWTAKTRAAAAKVDAPTGPTAKAGIRTPKANVSVKGEKPKFLWPSLDIGGRDQLLTLVMS